MQLAAWPSTLFLLRGSIPLRLPIVVSSNNHASHDCNSLILSLFRPFTTCQPCPTRALAAGETCSFSIFHRNHTRLFSFPLWSSPPSSGSCRALFPATSISQGLAFSHDSIVVSDRWHGLERLDSDNTLDECSTTGLAWGPCGRLSRSSKVESPL